MTATKKKPTIKPARVYDVMKEATIDEITEEIQALDSIETEEVTEEPKTEETQPQVMQNKQQETAEVTEIIEDSETTEVADAHKKSPRKTYTGKEADELNDSLKTQGRKGAKLQRLTVSVNSADADYIKTLALASGTDMKHVMHKIIDSHRKTHGDIYEQAKRIRDKI